MRPDSPLGRFLDEERQVAAAQAAVDDALIRMAQSAVRSAARARWETLGTLLDMREKLASL